MGILGVVIGDRVHINFIVPLLGKLRQTVQANSSRQLLYRDRRVRGHLLLIEIASIALASLEPMQIAPNVGRLRFRAPG
jgi:hypothetical protein